MKTTQVEIPNGKKAEWVEGVLTLIDDKPQDTHVYKVGDKAVLNKDTSFKKGDGVCLITKGNVVEIIYASYPNSHLFDIKFENAISTVRGEDLTPVITQDITERIKTFEDACEWCDNNDNENLTLAYKEISDSFKDMANMQDVFAYLKLRIITCALNEGWEPNWEIPSETGWSAELDSITAEDVSIAYERHGVISFQYAASLLFKTQELAEYAALQFRDIYMDFCYRGKE